MGRVDFEELGVFRPDFADVFVRSEAIQGLKALCEVVGGKEVGEMPTKLVGGFRSGSAARSPL